MPNGAPMEMTATNKIEEMARVERSGKKLLPKGKKGAANKTVLGEVIPLLEKYTCPSCHDIEKRRLVPLLSRLPKEGGQRIKLRGLYTNPS